MTLKLESALYATRAPGDLAKRTCSDSEATLTWATDYGKRGTKELKESGYKPAVLVTTSREALRAAWDLAYEVDEIPPSASHIAKSDLGITTTGNAGNCFAIVANSSGAERRLLDPPAPKSWETARYVYAGGEVYRRIEDGGSVFWAVPFANTKYTRTDIAIRNPVPVELPEENQ